MLQEETIRRSERDRKGMADKISSLERNIAAKDSEARQTQVRYLDSYFSNTFVNFFSKI